MRNKVDDVSKSRKVDKTISNGAFILHALSASKNADKATSWTQTMALTSGDVTTG